MLHLRSEATQRAYRTDWAQFCKWAQRHGLSTDLPIDHEDLARYIDDSIGKNKGRTIHRRLAGIKYHHWQNGYGSPTDHPDIALKRLEVDVATKRETIDRPCPLTYEDMCQVMNYVEAWPNKVKATRDKAILLTGWWGGLERQALASLQVNDVRWSNGNLVIQVRNFRQPRRIERPRDTNLDAAEAVKEWTVVADIHAGALFRRVDRWGNVGDRQLTGESIGEVVKQATECLPVRDRRYTANSLKYGPGL